MMLDKTFTIASLIGYLLLAFLLSEGEFLIVFFNLFLCALIMGSHLLFLGNAKWTETGPEANDHGNGPTLILCLFSFFFGRAIFHWIVTINQVYIETSTQESFATSVGAALAVLMLMLDLGVLRRQHSLRRRGWMLVFLIMMSLANSVLAHFAHATEYGGNGTRWWIDRMANTTEYLGFLLRFVYPIVWLIAPTIFILWQRANLESKGR